MSLQDKCSHFATQCGVVNFVPLYLPPMNGQSRVQLILVYFDKDQVCASLINIMTKQNHDSDFSFLNHSHI